ncbi:MAG: hypothetical protein QGD94_00705 [Planctomycetia bacterium]|nr:hypothetical protein [Planctomycetia bacterium]
MLVGISPKEWGLKSSEDEARSEILVNMGLDNADIEYRCRQNTYQWLMHQFNQEQGAFNAYYDPRSKTFAPPQNVNLIAPWQLLAAFDRYGDEKLLEMAKSATNWLHNHMVDLHPMSLVLGGVQDNLKPDQIWTKYTADYVVSHLGIYGRTDDDEYLRRAVQSGRFLMQSRHHGYAPTYDRHTERWSNYGWQSFARVIAARLGLYHYTNDEKWLRGALAWAQYGLTLQAENGCFYLVHDDYYSSDIAADEIRGLLNLYDVTQRVEFKEGAIKFADWHVANQLPNGAWNVTIHRSGISVSDYIGPGDVPNIAISLLMTHRLTGHLKYLVSAAKAIRYSLSKQGVPEDAQPYSEDPNICWGFWSWDPYYDYTMSADQSTHHVRGMWFFLDYFFSLDADSQTELQDALDISLRAT